MTLQRYRINNCADIADDNGSYCLSKDVAELEKSKWISVEDDSGDDTEGMVLCWNGEEFMLGYLSGNVCDDGEYTIINVTHWLIPEPPT